MQVHEPRHQALSLLVFELRQDGQQRPAWLVGPACAFSKLCSGGAGCRRLGMAWLRTVLHRSSPLVAQLASLARYYVCCAETPDALKGC